MSNKLLATEAHRIHEDLLYAEKAQFQMATVWRATHWVIGIPNVVAATVAGLAAVKASNPTLTAYAAVTAAILSALMTFLNPQKFAREHHSAGVRCSALRSKVRRFMEIDLAGAEPPKGARDQLEKVAKDKAHLMETTPHTGGLGYWLAKKSISKEQHKHEVDKKRAP